MKHLSTHDLRERGWTPAMIRDLLVTHDRERANELRVGRRDRRLESAVRLYREDRVLTAEASEAFAAAQDRARAAQSRAETAAATRRAAQETQAATVDTLPLPALTRHPHADTLSQTDLWQHHLDGYLRWSLRDVADALTGLPRALVRAAQNRAFERYRQAVYALYGWADHASAGAGESESGRA